DDRAPYVGAADGPRSRTACVGPYCHGLRDSSAIKYGLKCRADDWRQTHGTKGERTKEQRTKAQIGVVERELLCHPRPDMGDLLPGRGAGPCQAEPRRAVSQTAREDRYDGGPVPTKRGGTRGGGPMEKLRAWENPTRGRRLHPQAL